MVDITEKLLEEYFGQLKSQIDILKEENKEIKKKLDIISSNAWVVQILDLSEQQIEDLIIQYLQEHKGKEIYPSDIAFEFDLDARNVFEITERMKMEGKLK